jgi:hypothetical protein
MPVMKAVFACSSMARARGSASSKERSISAMSPLSVQDSRFTSSAGTEARMLYKFFGRTQ